MRTQAKSKARFSKGQFYRAMDMTAPNQSGVAFDNRAFTLVELIVSIGIIGILATMAIPAYSQLKNSAKVARAESEVRVIDKAINAYFIDKNIYPSTNALSVIGPEGSLLDPWGHPYQYIFPATYLDYNSQLINDDYDLFSLGTDGVTSSPPKLALPPASNDSSDDIIRAGSGGSVVLGETY